MNNGLHRKLQLSIKQLKRLVGAGSKKDMDAKPFFSGKVGPQALSSSTERKPVFAVGCGRSGTHFVARLLSRDSQIESYHMDNIGAPVGDSFLQYCAWNRLPVDLEGFFHKRESLINEARTMGRTYVEANPYLSFSIKPLFHRFRSRFLFVIRRPEATVNSHYVKGWYENPLVRSDLRLSLGFQYDLKGPHHFFGRFVPHGREFARWQRLTQIGKIAWMWNAFNLKIYHQLEQLPDEQHVVVKLEELDYARYLRVCSFVGSSSPVSEEDFDQLRRARPGQGLTHRTPDTWSEQERQEFELETKQAREMLGY